MFCRARLRRTLGLVIIGSLVAPAWAVVSSGTAARPAAAQTSFTISGGGWGHGVGMSQYGAKGRADAGQSAAQILAEYYPGAVVESRAFSGPRVKLGDANVTDLSSATGTIAVDGSGLAAPGERVTVRSVSGSLVYERSGQPITALAAPGAPATLSWSGGTITVSATGRSYQYGALRLIPNGNTFEMVVTGMSMQEYLYGLGEMPASWHGEALRAQAIAGRSFAAYRVSIRPQDPDFDMYASVSDQAYVGTQVTSGASGANWKAAVDATDAQVLTSAGSPIQAFYSSSNGGHSERTDYVFVASLPYFAASADPFDANPANPNAVWTRTFGGDELAGWLNAGGRGWVGSVTGISIGGNVGASGRVDKATVTVTGTLRTVTMTGNQFRLAVNAAAPSSRDLLSTKFVIGGPAAAETSPVPPPDTTAPDLKVLVANPMRFGRSGDICAFVLSDEVAITAIHIRLGRTELRSRVGGVGPAFPQIMCINIPPRLRPRRPTRVVLTGAALDAAANLRFVQPTVTIAR